MSTPEVNLRAGDSDGRTYAPVAVVSLRGVQLSAAEELTDGRQGLGHTREHDERPVDVSHAGMLQTYSRNELSTYRSLKICRDSLCSKHFIAEAICPVSFRVDLDMTKAPHARQRPDEHCSS